MQHVHAWFSEEVKKRVSDSLELKLQMDVSNHVGAGSPI